MSLLQFNFVSFREPLYKVIYNHPKTDALYIFPTEASKRIAIREFLQDWQLDFAQFMTMEEFKELLIDADKPLLKEEKRTLAFYGSLTQDDRAFLKISNYFSAVETAQQFFSLWEEFNEEMVDEAVQEIQLTEADAELLPWQKVLYARMREIKQRYQKFIDSKGYADLLFLMKPADLDLKALDVFKRFYFVNQFYYTALEKQIIRRLAETRPVTLFCQLPQTLFDTNSLEVSPFFWTDLGDGLSESIHIIECKNSFSMFAALIETLADTPIRHVVNFFPNRNPYARLMSPATFHSITPLRLCDTSIYRVIDRLHTLMTNLVWETHHKKLLVPLQTIIEAFADDHFCDMILNHDQSIKQKTVDDLYALAGEQLQFIDLDGQYFQKTKRHNSQAAVLTLFELLNAILSVRSIEDFISLIDTPNGLSIDAILTAEEKKTTNLKETVYRVLADFITIGNSRLVDDWQSVFQMAYVAPQARPAAGILRLFLDYIKSIHCRRYVRSEKAARVEFCGLQDTRNIAYKNAAVMNLVEKEIPHARSAPFLFTEKQRRLLGFKTYEDIKLREKYYLMRLILTTPHVFLFTQSNIEQNLEISSFVEEIKLFAQPATLSLSTVTKEPLRALYQHLLKSDTRYSVPTEKTKEESFYRIPYSPARDFPQGTLNLSYYSLDKLLNNPFAYYINFLSRVKERQKEIKREISPPLLGNVVHDIMSRLMSSIAEKNLFAPAQIDFADISTSEIEKYAQQSLQSTKFYYYFPHNHSLIYLQEIIKPILIESIRHFLHSLNSRGLHRHKTVILPEKNEYGLRDPYILLNVDQSIGLVIQIGGRADLRIEDVENGQFYIIDYKTGYPEKDQLLLYEICYYLGKDKSLAESVHSFVYLVFDARLQSFQGRKGVSKSRQIDEFLSEIENAVKSFETSGFGLPIKKSDLKEMEEITRADLYQNKVMRSVNRSRNRN
ncbi:MAG: hypothetical protein EHM72_05905 [Calditrichaeota bacterium]|nr:MAG: hypothetical protein EHM72_05905 [Calditrichota bacterium]